eukprot:6045690-Lingulodinium_polyedra.AAC.1
MASSDSRFKQFFPVATPGTALVAESVAVTWPTGEDASREKDITVTIGPATEEQAVLPLYA